MKKKGNRIAIMVSVAVSTCLSVCWKRILYYIVSINPEIVHAEQEHPVALETYCCYISIFRNIGI